jgi:hypothetical protein
MAWMRSGELDIQTNKHLALYSSSSTGCKDQMKPNHLKLLTKAEAMFQNFEQNPNSWFQDFPQKKQKTFCRIFTKTSVSLA